jgi:hypothetical protein
MNKLQFLIKKRKEKNFYFFLFVFITTLDLYPDPYQDPDSHDVSGFIESGATTLAPATVFRIHILWNRIHDFPELRLLQIWVLMTKQKNFMVGKIRKNIHFFTI